jgi:bifunctional ADP-heptose synthase (sugar kinase/adenylyltransferase)/phosphoglycolate phosphatase-like HAD superfamily hydrolase
MRSADDNPDVIVAFRRTPAKPLDLANLLQRIGRTRIGLVGDLCLDAYWTIDLAASETSIETGLTTRPVRTQRYSLGGAANVAHNLASLGIRDVHLFGIVGADPFAREMLGQLKTLGLDLSGVITQADGWGTHVYIKPVNDGHEENRIDLGNFNVLQEKTADKLLAAVAAALPALDALIINEQIGEALHSPHFRAGLNRLIEAHADHVLFIADCRHLSEAYPDCLHKINEFEAARISGLKRNPDEQISLEESRQTAQRLYQKWNQPVFITRGARGCIVHDHDGEHLIAGLHILKKTDPVGAGDSMVAGIAAAMAAEASAAEAATFGNFVAGVTVQKLFQTGTATPAEVLAIGTAPDYVYEPELADNPREARFQTDTEVEVINPPEQNLTLRYAIFDHDGTISTLRQGWEEVMEPMMIRAILGEYFETCDARLFNRIQKQVREFIDKTTGIQTLVQMQGLVELVRDFGMVPEAQVLDAAGYKHIYNEALMERVSQRLARLARRELTTEDFTVKNAVALLRRLHNAGVRLYLASGTDQEDVVAEATALGYAHYFEGRIMGAVGNVQVEAKRIVLEQILGQIGPGEAAHIVTFGDGPVEIRETRKRGGFTVGVASNEVQRYGLVPEKRSRLIRAGADLVVPDFSQLEALLAMLGFGAKRARCAAGAKTRSHS